MVTQQYYAYFPEYYDDIKYMLLKNYNFYQYYLSSAYFNLYIYNALCIIINEFVKISDYFHIKWFWIFLDIKRVCSNIFIFLVFLGFISKQFLFSRTNHMDDHVVEKVAALKADRIRSVTGEVVCEEEDSVVNNIIKTLYDSY